MSGNLWQRVGSHPAAFGRVLRSHPAEPGLPDVRLNSAQESMGDLGGEELSDGDQSHKRSRKARDMGNKINCLGVHISSLP